MSYSKTVKQEIVKVRLRGMEIKRAQLMGLTHACAALILGATPRVEYTTESYDVGKLTASLAGELYEIDATLALRETGRTRQTIVTLNGAGARTLLFDAGLFTSAEDGVELTNIVPDAVFAKQEAARAFLRGAFLGSGSVANPKRSYHLEIVCRNDELAKDVIKLLNSFDCGAKMVRRNNNTVVYLKDGDKIAMVLTLLGAPASTLLFEDARTEKELRNYINRTSNCETANITKTVNASAEQIEAIRKVLASPSVSKRLSLKLRETAELRLNNPEMSLSELSELCGIGKSGINHRLQRLITLAEELR